MIDNACAILSMNVHCDIKLQENVVENTLSCNMRYVWPRRKYLLLCVIFTQTI